jgi:hypothetical protein
MGYRALKRLGMEVTKMDKPTLDLIESSCLTGDQSLFEFRWYTIKIKTVKLG